MKNLTILYQKIYDLNSIDSNNCKIEEVLNDNVKCCTNPDNDTLYLLEINNLYCINPDGIRIEKDLTFDLNSKPVGVEYYSDDDSLFCGYANGDLLKISLEQFPFQPELIKHFDDGLKCMQLSPDQEILIFVTENEKVVTMMSCMEKISEVDLNSSEFGNKQFVTAGWGSKETQFHGSEGKAAAKAKTVIIGKTETDNDTCSISWRGDGALFAVTFLNKQQDVRQFKVFSRDGVLQFTSEVVNGLEENISWRPSGNLIATSQRLSTSHLITFFEKNGLKHRDLTLPFQVNEMIIKRLLWSPDSDILTVLCQQVNTNKMFIQLWSENNYHWYLKQLIEFNQDNPLIYYSWSLSSRNRKHLNLLTKKKLIIYSFRWTINHSRCQSIDDKAVVGVIDNDKILITGFKMGIVPPPMCHQTLQLKSTINQIMFIPFIQHTTWLNPNSLFCLLQNNQLALFNHINTGLIEYKYVGSYEIGWNVPKLIDEDVPNSMHHFLWFKEDIILCCLTTNNHDYLCTLELKDINSSENNQGRIVVRETLLMLDRIQHIVPSPDANVAYLIVGNDVLKYIYDEGIIIPTKIIIPESCDHVEVIEIEKRHLIIALTNKNHLYIDGVEIANNITSIFIHSNFLLLTTLQHALVSVSMNTKSFNRLSMSNLSVQSWTEGSIEQESHGLSIRRLERTSSLVMAIPEDSKVIVQIKRGNLETIQPRALSLHIIKNHLNIGNYYQAFDIMRKQRINLNLIYDHNPNLFISNVEKFIDSIKNSNWLNLFISDLQDEDVTETIYKACYTESDNDIRKCDMDYSDVGKVEQICQLLRKIMEEKAASRNLIQPILTCLVKNKHVAGIEAALNKIKEFKLKDEASINHQQTAEEALKYLLYLIDVDVLYDIALGTYDLELAKFVASKSMKDPKEYIPYLNSLEELDENYRKFKIDKDLKRYESSLDHISKCPDKFNECIEMICTHELFTKAMKLFTKDSDEYKKVSKICGKYFFINKKYREAGIMYERSGDLAEALKLYKVAGYWQNAIIVATKMDLTPKELIELYEYFVRHLRDDRRYRDAAKICVTYLDQIEEAVSLLCEGKEWQDAMRFAHTSKRLDLLETHIKPGVIEHANDISLKMIKNQDEFIKHKKRLATVRKEKAKAQQLMNHLLIDDEKVNDMSDLLSDTTSIVGSTSSVTSKSSRTSGRSYRSGKNKRKQERKILSIKKGSAFEDLALIRALHLIITTTYAQRDEVKAVNLILLAFDCDELAEKLQNQLIFMLNLIERSKYEIWVKNSADGDDMDSNAPTNILEPKFYYPPDAGCTKWMLDMFHSPTDKNTYCK